MAPPLPKILIVEDVPTLAETYVAYLSSEPVIATAVQTGHEALAQLEDCPPDVVALDINLPDMNGIDLLREIKSRGLPTEVIIVTAQGSLNLAVETMREGAFDFIVKPLTRDRLRVTLRNALERRNLTNTVEALKEEFGRDHFCGQIGRSLTMQSVYRIIQSAAPSSATVFITGESGTGKELCAAAIHHLSKRKDKPFVAVNCAAIPRDLLESELFGHVKGAFTGATANRLGAALQADGGTLFLDEIGEMDPALQAKMLRFLQTGQVQRLGDDRTRQADLRVVCATNRDPRAAVAQGRFREDLFYRLYVIPVQMPPLRERDDDVLLLGQHFLQEFAKRDGKRFNCFSPEAEDALLSYSWPGNVRELQNVIRNVVVLNDGETVDVSMLPSEIAQSGASSEAKTQVLAPPPQGSIVPLDEVIDRAIANAIALNDGSIPKAAAALKVSPSTIYRRRQARG